MENIDIKNILRNQFPVFDQGELIDELSTKGIYKYIPSDQYILEVGNFIKVVPLIIKGSVKVIREEGEGELLLYYIKPGESCALTLSSCMRKEQSSIKAIAQEDTELIALPVEDVYYMVRKYPAWQDFIINSYSYRFEEVMQVLDNIAFHKMDERLVKYLIRRAGTFSSLELNISHQEIADDLATSREVISRLLKQLEKKGSIRLSRGKIKLIHLKA